MRMAGFPVTRNAVSELLHAQLVTLLGAKKTSALLGFDPPVEMETFPQLNLPVSLRSCSAIYRAATAL